MRLKLAVKRVAAMFSEEERAAANEKELLKIVRNLIWLDSTREYLDMSKPAVDEDDEDAEFVDSYDQLLDRFTKVVCDAEKQQVMSNAVTVGKKRRRSSNTEEKGKPTANEEKEEKPTTDVEDSESDTDDDADPRHRPSEKKQKEEKPVWQGSAKPVWQSERRCYNCGGFGHEQRDCHKGKGKGKGFERQWHGGGKGRPFDGFGKGFDKGFGKGKSGGHY